jgi:secreted Zn-dependent insulinase-like peptidase
MAQKIQNLPLIPELRMPDPNPFIPKDFTVHRKEVEIVTLA